MKRGFTLIELLVVVLIIGILSAVALPSYQKAVNRSKAAEAWTLGKAFLDAQNVYVMENGRVSDSLDDLSYDFPTELKDWETSYVSSYVGSAALIFQGKGSLESARLSYFFHMPDGVYTGSNRSMSCGGGDICSNLLPCGNGKVVTDTGTATYTNYECNNI